MSSRSPNLPLVWTAFLSPWPTADQGKVRLWFDF
jgi:hypothetical protein